MFNSMLGKLTGNSKTPDQKAADFETGLAELKLKCQPVFEENPSEAHSEASLRRFLRGYTTADAAFVGITKYNKWRKEFQVDSLTSSDPDIISEMSKGVAHLLRTRDVKSRPVLYIIARKHVAADRDLDKLTKFTVYLLEQTFQRLDEQIIDNICIVFDMKQFSMANMDYQFVKKLIWLLGKYYPERLGICLVYNAPVMFQGCWAVIRPWLNEITASKVVFVSNETQICQYLNPDALPPSED
ncbi:uncharacterized protein LOC106078063 [Biomphalaria glabrata]|uniref:Uncharacterized protein LOC106078063 n=1 Tax=Biomphalaria glabrata TaxID=6526 RepID=A0A9W3B599_BIOGL|nr:uncharacterized protein LOC106078063 [Biomphalaria glabrata]